MYNAEGAVGIFDSGVGGLTVVREVAHRLPHEDIIYLGDTARVPYGTKSSDTVVRYARACARILLERNIKLLVVGCNTASAFALDVLREELDVPVVGVVQPGALSAVRQTKNGRIGVIGTRGTIASGEYQAALERLSPGVVVYTKACPLFVPLAEEGWTEGEVPRNIAAEYLGELMERNIDTLVLGCTHYPLLRDTIESVVGSSATLVDSAEATSEVVVEILNDMDARKESGPQSIDFLVSDSPEHFAAMGKAFLGRDIDRVEWVDF